MDSNKKKVYVVTDGSYSDYSIVAVFDDKEMAEEFRQKFNYDNLEEYTLNPAMREIRAGFSVYAVVMTREGNVESVKRRDNQWLDSVQFLLFGYNDDIKQWVPKSHPDKRGKAYIDCWAKDEQHAIKIANDTRTQAIALGNWPALPKEWK